MFTFSLPRLAPADHQALVARSVAIVRDGSGEDVHNAPEGLMAKIFFRKRFLTSSQLLSYATRFVRNARHLVTMVIRRNPLNARLRACNFRHLLRYRQDNGHLRIFGFVRFVENCLEAAELAQSDR